MFCWRSASLDGDDNVEITSEPGTTSTEDGGPSKEDWELGFRLLGDHLSSHDGCISTVALVRELRKHGIDDPRPLVVALQFFDPDSSPERGISAPSFKFGHLGRSFYSEERYRQELKNQEKATAEEAEDASREVSGISPEEVKIPRAYREARLVTYVKSALEEVYASDVGPEDTDFVFDVHSARKGISFENVDLIAVHWRSSSFLEFITVEVKLEFSAQVVQQALNYTRFSHRVWVAVLVETDQENELPKRFPALFDYAVSQGLGVLACRRRKGRRYEVRPVHWPLRNQPDPLAEEEFIERYREQLEKAEAVDTKEKRPRPRFR